jgi:hypothetical protein
VTTIPALARLSSGRFETPAILKGLALASRKLAELKGVAASIPNQSILINTFLGAVERTAGDTINTIVAIRSALMDYKHRIRNQFKFYSQDLINNLFTHPYTKIAFIERDLKVSRITATKYLDTLAEHGFLQKQKIGRANYYVNIVLNRILIGAETGAGNV